MEIETERIWLRDEMGWDEMGKKGKIKMRSFRTQTSNHKKKKRKKRKEENSLTFFKGPSRMIFEGNLIGEGRGE